MNVLKEAVVRFLPHSSFHQTQNKLTPAHPTHITQQQVVFENMYQAKTGKLSLVRPIRSVELIFTDTCLPTFGCATDDDQLHQGSQEMPHDSIKMDHKEVSYLAEYSHLMVWLEYRIPLFMVTLFSAFLCWLVRISSGGWQIVTLAVALMPMSGAIALNSISISFLVAREANSTFPISNTKTPRCEQSLHGQSSTKVTSPAELAYRTRVLRKWLDRTATITWFFVANTLMVVLWLAGNWQQPLTWAKQMQYMVSMYFTITAIGQDLGLLHGIGLRRPNQMRVITEKCFILHQIFMMLLLFTSYNEDSSRGSLDASLCIVLFSTYMAMALLLYPGHLSTSSTADADSAAIPSSEPVEVPLRAGCEA